MQPDSHPASAYGAWRETAALWDCRMRNSLFEVTMRTLVINGTGLGSQKQDQPEAITEIDASEAVSCSSKGLE